MSQGVRAISAGSALLMLMACASKGGSPAAPSPSPAPSSLQVAGQAVGALDGHAVTGASVAPDGLIAVIADASGYFTVQAQATGNYRATVSGGDVLDRQTTLHVPAANVQLSLIPRAFDLTAFDEMFRQAGSKLQRWTKAPALVVILSELTFTSVTAAAFTATARQMSAGDANGIVDDLTSAVSLMTGNTVSAFASVSTEVVAQGTAVSVQRDGTIVVARYQGLTAATGYAGYGRWATVGEGTVTAGSALFDADFDRSANSNRRTLHIHELGHTLGYSHVLARLSVMNASPSTGPNGFDRDAARIAFQRPPGSRSPDVDPASFVMNALASDGPAIWGPAIP